MKYKLLCSIVIATCCLSGGVDAAISAYQVSPDSYVEFTLLEVDWLRNYEIDPMNTLGDDEYYWAIESSPESPRGSYMGTIDIDYDGTTITSLSFDITAVAQFSHGIVAGAGSGEAISLSSARYVANDLGISLTEGNTVAVNFDLDTPTRVFTSSVFDGGMTSNLSAFNTSISADVSLIGDQLTIVYSDTFIDMEEEIGDEFFTIRHGYNARIFTIIPEPSTCLLTLLGGVFCTRRKRLNK